MKTKMMLLGVMFGVCSAVMAECGGGGCGGGSGGGGGGCGGGGCFGNGGGNSFGNVAPGHNSNGQGRFTQRGWSPEQSDPGQQFGFRSDDNLFSPERGIERNNGEGLEPIPGFNLIRKDPVSRSLYANSNGNWTRLRVETDGTVADPSGTPLPNQTIGEILAYYNRIQNPEEYFGPERYEIVKTIQARYRGAVTPQQYAPIPALRYQFAGDVKRNGEKWELDFHDLELKAKQEAIAKKAVGDRTDHEKELLDKSIIRTASWDSTKKTWLLLGDEDKLLAYDRNTNRFLPENHAITLTRPQIPIPNLSQAQPRGITPIAKQVTLVYCAACFSGAIAGVKQALASQNLVYQGVAFEKASQLIRGHLTQKAAVIVDGRHVGDIDTSRGNVLGQLREIVG